MEKIRLTVDDSDIVTEKGSTILEAALSNGIYIPHLCYHPDLKPAGACRLCMVEVDDGELIPSCVTPVRQRMVVRTTTPEIDKARRALIELIIADHHTDCRNCPTSGQCELQKIMAYLRVSVKRMPPLRLAKDELPQDTSNPFFDYDLNKCVLCGICVRTCSEIQGRDAIDFVGRGYTTKVAPFGGKPLAKSRCESCGECVVRCPVGALVLKNIQRPLAEVKTVCPYCAVGCGIYLGTRNNGIVSVRGDNDNPVNRGKLCVRGRFGWSFVHSPDRLTSPLIKRDGEFVEASWDEALALVSDRLAKYKGDQFALFTSAKCTNEANYVAQKFARAVMVSNNIDNSARLSDAPTSAGLHEGIGMRALVDSAGELENAACILAIGANVTQTHPVAGLKIRKGVQNGAKLIVINPREIDLCRSADLWLRLHPGTDVALIMGMAKVIIDDKLFDPRFVEQYCDNFEEFRKLLDDFDLDQTEKITGVSKETIVEAAKVYATAKPSVVIWSAGITQHSHGTDNVLALINLAILTGNDSKSSLGLYPLRSENNAHGVCDMGCLPNFYPGYQPVTNSELQKKFESSWGVSLSPKLGLTLTDIPQAVLGGQVKALYIMGANPVLAMPDSQKVGQALEETEFIVVQDIFLNETAKFADVVLPAASFAEEDGTFTNTERRIQRVRRAIEPIGNSRPDWEIVCELAKRLKGKGFEFSDPSEIMSEIASVSPIYEAVSYDRLENEGFQWSCDSLEDSNHKVKLTPLGYRPSAEVSDEGYPLILTTDMSLYGQGVLSRKVEGLNILRGKEVVEINPKDASDLGINSGDIVRVISRRGETRIEARVTATSPLGVVTMGAHSAETNLLTNPASDPATKTPETKVCAVRIVPETQ